MPGYAAQESDGYLPPNFSRPTKSIRLGELKGATQRSPDPASHGHPEGGESPMAYPAYPPPPYSRGANVAVQGGVNNPVGRDGDEMYVEGELFGEIVPASHRNSRISPNFDSGSTRGETKRRHKPNLSIDTSVAKNGAKPKQIKRVGRLDSSRRSIQRHDPARPSRAKDLIFLAPMSYNASGRYNPRAPSSVYSRDTISSRPTGTFSTVSAYLPPQNPRDSVATDFEEDEPTAQKERILSTGTVFEEDQVARSRSNTGESTITPTPRRSKGWWNVITTPFQSQKRFTQQVSEMEKVPDVPALPQAFSAKPKPRDTSKNLRIRPEEVQRYIASRDSGDQQRSRIRQDSNGSSTTSIEENDDESGQQHNRIDRRTGSRRSRKSTIPSQRGTTRFSEFSPDDREVPVMLSGDPEEFLPRTSTSSRRPQPTQWLTSLRASENQPVSTWSPLTSVQDESPESQRSHFHSPVIRPVAIDSIVGPSSRSQPDPGQLPLQNAASRPTQHSPHVFAFKRASHSAQWGNAGDSGGVPAVPYRPDDHRSPYYNTKSTPGVGRHKPTSSFAFSEAPEEKKQRVQKKRRKRFCCLCILIILLLLLAVAVVVPVVVTRQHHTSTPSIWVNLTDFPPMPTGALTIAQPNMVYNVTGCVNPSAMWSCAVPKEQQAAIAPNQPDQPDFLFTIYYVNSNTSSSSSTVFQPSPGPPALDEQTFLGNTTDNNTQPFEGVDTPFYISFNPPTTASSPSKKLRKRQGGSNGINTSQTQLGGSAATTSASGSASTTTNTIPDLATAIPLPSTNPDGTALPANLLPFPLYQPIRLYNKGLSTEHYGFYTYFDRSIFMKSITIQNSTAQAEGDIPADANGGSTFVGANARCTWADTRFLVQIWTHKNATLLAKPSGSPTSSSSAAAASASGETVTTFVRPGSMPYPVTVTLDRHGGGLTTKMLYCYGLDARGDVVDNEKVFQPENRSFGGTLVNPAEGPFMTVNVSTAMGGPGGIDGGTGGCSCLWQNF